MRNYPNSKKALSEEAYKDFQAEMERLSRIKWHGYRKTLNEVGVSYIGGANISAKLKHNYSVNVLTYCIYLSAADNAFGLEVCGKETSKHCREFCLVKSGHAKVESLANQNKSFMARARRTMLFHANRSLFTKIADFELRRYMRYAEKNGYIFSVRFNCTSDISLETLKYADGHNILQEFPSVTFYDYTKVPSRLSLANKYPNYSITFSFDGHNKANCMKWLSEGHNVAVVFKAMNIEEIPDSLWGYDVIKGDEYDARFLDPKGVIVGLKYKWGAQDYEKGKDGFFHFKGFPDSPFLISI